MITILVLDDESIVLRLLCYLLQCYGYGTVGAGNAEEALLRFHDSHDRVDLLIADVSLPQGSGIQVALTLRAERPDLPVILTSGYPGGAWNTPDRALLQKLGPDSVSILQKPFGPQVLLSTIRELTGSGHSEAVEPA
jgi:CheY-like chemotaxis protein